MDILSTLYFHEILQNEDVDTADSASSNNANVTRSIAAPTTAPPSSSAATVGAENETSSPSAVQEFRAQSSADEETTTTNSSSSVDDSNESGLPTGWSLQVAPNGRIFFIDHNLRKTSWVDPRTGRASPMPNQGRKPEDDLGALPEGWEERVHSDGRIFFIDHSE